MDEETEIVAVAQSRRVENNEHVPIADAEQVVIPASVEVVTITTAAPVQTTISTDSADII
jgi:low affinity Fe/Cu permease